MPKLVDTTIRLLGQEPLAGRMPTAAVLRLAGILDEAGFGLLEVSGGGVFDSAVRRGVESTWERIRAIHARTKTPLGMALRGRFLVGSRPVDGDFVRRFVASAAESGIDVFRLHDPLNDVSNLREAAEAIEAAGREFDAGLVYSPGKTGETHELVEPVTPLAPRVAARAAEHSLPAGLVAALDVHLRAHAASDRIDDVLEELERIRAEVGSPPLAAPIGHILASQALLNVLSASRYQTLVDELRALLEGRYGTPPGQVDPTVRRAAELLGGAGEEEEEVGLTEVRASAEGLAASEEELRLLGLFGEEAEPLLRMIRGRSHGEESLAAGAVDQARAERIREIVRIVQDSGVGEVTIEDDDLRVTVRRTDDRLPDLPQAPAGAPLAVEEPEPAPVEPPSDGLVRVEAPMVGTFYRASQPGAPPFVEEGDPVAPGQTLCILEAMKLMNEVKADVEGIVRTISVENAQPVEFGQLLFELEPLNGRPLDAL